MRVPFSPANPMCRVSLVPPWSTQARWVHLLPSAWSVSTTALLNVLERIRRRTFRQAQCAQAAVLFYGSTDSCSSGMVCFTAHCAPGLVLVSRIVRIDAWCIKSCGVWDSEPRGQTYEKHPSWSSILISESAQSPGSSVVLRRTCHITVSLKLGYGDGSGILHEQHRPRKKYVERNPFMR